MFVLHTKFKLLLFRLSEAGETQPNGADTENCVAISLRSVQFQPSWQDVQCTFSDTSTYICKTNQMKGKEIPMYRS